MTSRLSKSHNAIKSGCKGKCKCKCKCQLLLLNAVAHKVCKQCVDWDRGRIRRSRAHKQPTTLTAHIKKKSGALLLATQQRRVRQAVGALHRCATQSTRAPRTAASVVLSTATFVHGERSARSVSLAALSGGQHGGARPTSYAVLQQNLLKRVLKETGCLALPRSTQKGPEKIALNFFFFFFFFFFFWFEYFFFGVFVWLVLPIWCVEIVCNDTIVTKSSRYCEKKLLLRLSSVLSSSHHRFFFFIDFFFLSIFFFFFFLIFFFSSAQRKKQRCWPGTAS